MSREASACVRGGANEMPRVSAKNSGASPGGSMVTRMVTKALNRLSMVGMEVPRPPSLYRIGAGCQTGVRYSCLPQNASSR